MCGSAVSISEVPVVRANALIDSCISSDARLRTHCLVRRMLVVVCEAAASPNMHRLPSHHADDIGAMLDVPSSFKDVMSTTGVPQ